MIIIRLINKQKNELEQKVRPPFKRVVAIEVMLDPVSKAGYFNTFFYRVII